MKKLWKAGTMLATVAVMMCVGIYAATTATHNTNSTVSFVSTNVYVDIDGTSTLGDKKAYAGATYEKGNFGKDSAKETAEAWDLGDMKLDESNFTAVITFKFTNQGDALTKITITAPTFGADSSFEMGKKVKIGDEAEVVLDQQEIILKYGETATFTYTITLKAYNMNVATEDCNFVVSLAKTEPAAPPVVA